MLTCVVLGMTTAFALHSELVNAGTFPDRIITGKVIDTDGVALPGANVILRGTSTGTTTDVEGKYSLTVPDEGGVLVFSYIGYAPLEVPIGNQSVVDVTLSLDIQSLSEIVVVGYGVQKKSDVTGAVSSVKGGDLVQLPSQRVDQALQGRAAGVMVLSPSGQPGGATTIRIRGSNSINGSNDPLVVIDGLQGGDINSINPNDVESIEILKDASATAIYGSQGANGVILITTKSGKKGAPAINYGYNYSVQQLRKKLDLMDAPDFARTINAYRATLNQPGADVIVPTPIFTDGEIAAFESNGGTDWQDEIYRSAPMHAHQLSISGGSDNIQYFVSGSYLDQEGILINSAFERLTLRANVNVKMTKWADFGLNWTGIREKGNSPPFGEGVADIDPLGQVVSLAPRWAATIPVYDQNGNYSRHPNNFGEPGLWNPVASGREPQIENNAIRNNLNAYFDFKIAEGLTFRVSGGANIRNNNDYRYLNILTRDGSRLNGTGFVRDGLYTRYQNSNILTYDKKAGQHQFTVTAVVEQQIESSKGTQTNASDFLVDAAGVFNLGGARTLIASAYNNKRVINSYLGRLNYAFKDKLLLTASYRADGSSVFGANNKWGYFPSASVAYKLSEESFISDLDFVTELKVRGSWGVTGSQAISPYGTLAQIASNVNYPYNGNNTTDIGFNIIRAANPNLKWESTTQKNAGLDAAFFNGRLTTTIDYYIKTTEDLLLSRSLPTYTGFNSIIDNVGSIENKGIEISIGADPMVGEFKWNTSVNFSRNRSEVVSLGELSTLPFRTTTGGGYGFSTNNNTALFNLQPGRPFGEMTGWITEGTWNESERDQAAVYGQLPGDIKYRDINNDGAINRADLTVIGNALPDFMFGWNNRFSYKNFELIMLIQGTQGNDLFNVGRIRLERPGEGTSAELLNRWTPENQDTDVPAFILQSERRAAALTNRVTGIDTRLSRWVEDASYVRLRNITLAYNFPQSMSEKIGMSRIRAYVTGMNLFTITKYTGYDPEISSFNSGDARMGIDFGSYPTSRVFTLGVDLSF